MPPAQASGGLVSRRNEHETTTKTIIIAGAANLQPYVFIDPTQTRQAESAG